jgi:hypothetical protein
VAAAAAEPAAPGGTAAAGRGGTSVDPSARAPARPRVSAALAALRDTLAGASPAGAAAEALGVDGLFAALLREASAPPGPHATKAAMCLLAIGLAAGTGGPVRPDQRATADAVAAAVRRDTAGLFDATGRAAAMQAAGRAAGDAAPGGSSRPPAGAVPAAAAAADAAAAAAAPGMQLVAMFSLVDHLVSEAYGPGDDALAKAFARSGGAVAAALELLLHGCPGYDPAGHARIMAARALMSVCRDLAGVRHLRGAFPRVVPALLQRLERGAPGSTRDERLCVTHALMVRWGCT